MDVPGTYSRYDPTPKSQEMDEEAFGTAKFRFYSNKLVFNEVLLSERLFSSVHYSMISGFIGSILIP